ncbi:MAG: hypothetical protein WBB01_25500 [Phormidesmis sp.]
MRIVQIVPRLPPVIDGVGDYAYRLAQQMRQDFDIQTHFIVGDPNWIGPSDLGGFSVSRLSRRSASDLRLVLKHQPSAIIFLHYVSYGYAKRGCPNWLVNALNQWHASNSNARLVTMFHEVYASGSPWTSSFWLLPLQKKLIFRLTQLSNACFTNRQEYAQRLQRLNSKKTFQAAVLPVFSNIGELTQASPLAERSKRLVIFGSRNARLWAYEQCLSTLNQICADLDIQEICDIGVPTGLSFSNQIDVPVIEKGICSAQEVSAILANSIASFSNFPPPSFFAKSTVFAAYCAHKLIPITAFPDAPITDGLQSGTHYWSMHQPTKKLSLTVAQTIADQAYDWYQNHTLSKQAVVFAYHFHIPSIALEKKNELLSNL